MERVYWGVLFLRFLFVELFCLDITKYRFSENTDRKA
jgi:hypothetical protein